MNDILPTVPATSVLVLPAKKVCWVILKRPSGRTATGDARDGRRKYIVGAVK